MMPTVCAEVHLEAVCNLQKVLQCIWVTDFCDLSLKSCLLKYTCKEHRDECISQQQNI